MGFNDDAGEEEIRIRAFRHSDLDVVKGLFTAYHQWLGLDLSYQNYSTEFDNLPGDYDGQRGGALLLAVKAGTVVGCVALRALTKSHFVDQGIYCEMKRLYVDPAARGERVGHLLVSAILRAAAQLHYRFCVLDTLSTMTGAVRLYENFGFRRIEKYYDTPIEQTVFFRKQLADSV